MGQQYEPMLSDALCVQVMYSALRELGFNMQSVEIKVNHCRLLRGILSCCGIPAHLHAPLKNVLLVSVGMLVVDVPYTTYYAMGQAVSEVILHD